MTLRAPERMTPEEILAEMGEVEEQVQDRLLRIRGLMHSLYARTRRAPSDVNTAVYLRYASAWGRYSAAASQGLARTVRTARGVARQLTPQNAGTIDNPAQKSAPKRQEPAHASPVEELLSMYTPIAAPALVNEVDED